MLNKMFDFSLLSPHTFQSQFGGFLCQPICSHMKTWDCCCWGTLFCLLWRCHCVYEWATVKKSSKFEHFSHQCAFRPKDSWAAPYTHLSLGIRQAVQGQNTVCTFYIFTRRNSGVWARKSLELPIIPSDMAGFEISVVSSDLSKLSHSQKIK